VRHIAFVLLHVLTKHFQIDEACVVCIDESENVFNLEVRLASDYLLLLFEFNLELRLQANQLAERSVHLNKEFVPSEHCRLLLTRFRSRNLVFARQNHLKKVPVFQTLVVVKVKVTNNIQVVRRFKLFNLVLEHILLQFKLSDFALVGDP
jgi:hypothetical protein